MILQTIVGYCFALANEFIGIYFIKDLSLMKGDIKTIKLHKLYGRTEILIFYALMSQCLFMLYMHIAAADPNLLTPSGVWAHSWWGGFLAVALVTFKFYFARWKKDEIYKYGKYIGPIGFTGWSLSHWTSLYNFYFVVNANGNFPIIFIPTTFIWAAIIPFFGGVLLFMLVLLRRKADIKRKGRFGINQIAFVLHGITFGYENSAKELLGTPALFKYVVPQTYAFIERMMTMSGFNMKKLEQMSLPDAMKEFMNMAETVGMAEKIKVKWISDNQFSVESVNCSTSAVRSVMTEKELTNAICPWAIFAASIANKITGKELKMDASEFSAIGAKTKLTILDEK